MNSNEIVIKGVAMERGMRDAEMARNSRSCLRGVKEINNMAHGALE